MTCATLSRSQKQRHSQVRFPPTAHDNEKLLLGSDTVQGDGIGLDKFFEMYNLRIDDLEENISMHYEWAKHLAYMIKLATLK